jgi:hypothetical protein
MAYKCRAYPDGVQQHMLARTFGCVRLVWDQTLAERRRLYHGEGKGLSCACGADVRHVGTPPVRSAVKQEPLGVSPGIPVLQGGE